jgi:hypothetical protein
MSEQSITILPPDDLIFISAQPGDTPRFLWELEVQMSNFTRLGIDPVQMHMLLCYIGKPADIALRFMEKYYKTFPNIFLYPDMRQDAGKAIYQPSIRPHLLKQHFARLPQLQERPIFYHDSDIIFQKLPDFNFLCGNNVNYLSDTNSYLNADYVESKGDGLLEGMCNVVGVDPQVVRDHNLHSGGAQYLLKNIDAQFWQDVENHAVQLYTYMVSSKAELSKKWAEKTGNEPSAYHEIQAWCADMWAIFYNLLKRTTLVEVTPELSFSWATSNANEFFQHNIFHNAGVTGAGQGLFYKGDYLFKSPLLEDHSYVNPDTASYHYVQEFKNIKTS